jgi:SOS-response transcriptional repressor LexA
MEKSLQPEGFMAEIQQMTGFQSPCTEYAEDELSLEKFFVTDKPAMVFVRAAQAYPHYQINKGDLMLIHRGQQPKSNQVVVAVISNNFVFARFQWVGGKGILMPFNRPIGDVENGEDFIWGIVASIHRNTRV